MKKILFESNKNIIFKSLKLTRVKEGLTQAQLAAKMQVLGVNIDQQMISKIENNLRFVTDYELACICKSLNVALEKVAAAFNA